MNKKRRRKTKNGT